ncbi:hypothetical protein [Ferruginibacter sp.]
MPNSIDFKLLSDAELTKEFGKVKLFKADQPKTAVTTAALKSKLKDFQGKQAAPTDTVKLENITAVSLNAAAVAKIRAINESTTPTAEALAGQKMDPSKVIGTLFSSVSTLEFTKMESEFKTRMAAATTAAAKAKVQGEWDNVVKAGSQVFASAGLKNVKESDLRKFSQELVASKPNFNAIVKIANSGVAVAGVPAATLTGQTVLKGGFVPQTGVLIDNSVVATSIANLCSVPFKEGTFTKHFSKSFSLTVRIPYWCPSWTNPFRVCHKNVVLAGASFSVDVSVGYRVTCCGATAWGRASAQACATLVGITFCAGCTATITGVAGVGRTTSGSNCTYGIGINAQLKCTFGGITVLNLQAPFGFNVTGPCPPAGFCS